MNVGQLIPLGFISPLVPNLTVTILSRRLATFGHIVHTDDDTDAKMILKAPPLEKWKRPPGRPHITWLIEHCPVRSETYNLTLNKAVDLAQNRPMCWCLCMALRTNSGACQKRRRTYSRTEPFGICNTGSSNNSVKAPQETQRSSSTTVFLMERMLLPLH